MSMQRIRTAASALCLAAAVTTAMLPVTAEARGWGGRGNWGGGWGRGHHDDIDAGDVFAGLLIIGGIAAIASAASKADRPQRQSVPSPDYRDPAPRYGDRDDRPSWQEGRAVGSGAGRGIDGAVDACVGEVERGTRRVDTVDGVRRDQNGWRVDGRVRTGQGFACEVDAGGSVRRVTVDGAAI